MSRHICHVGFCHRKKSFFGFYGNFYFSKTYSGNLCLHSTQICQVHTNKCASLFNFIESCFLQSNNTLLVGTENIYIFFAAMTSGFLVVGWWKRCDVKTCFHGLTFQIKKRTDYRFMDV